MPVKCVQIELGVCQRPALSHKEVGVWSYDTIPVPAVTPAEELKDLATREFLSKHEDVFVHHTWIQCVGPEVVLELENEDDILSL